MVSVYDVDYERDSSGRWVGSVRHVPGCHTQGRTIAQTRERIRAALSLAVDDADTAVLVDHIKIPSKVRQAVNRYAAARKRAESVSSEASVAAREAVQALAGGA